MNLSPYSKTRLRREATVWIAIQILSLSVVALALVFHMEPGRYNFMLPVRDPMLLSLLVILSVSIGVLLVGRQARKEGLGLLVLRAVVLCTVAVIALGYGLGVADLAANRSQGDSVRRIAQTVVVGFATPVFVLYVAPIEFGLAIVATATFRIIGFWMQRSRKLELVARDRE